MTINDNEDRIVRIAQKFFDSITFSLNEPVKTLETEIKEEQQPLEADSNDNRYKLFNFYIEEALKKKRKGWNVGEVLSGNELTNFHGKRLIFSNQRVKNNFQKQNILMSFFFY